jgi:hypothetical protein
MDRALNLNALITIGAFVFICRHTNTLDTKTDRPQAVRLGGLDLINNYTQL